MSDLFSAFGDGVGDVVASPFIQVALRAVALYVVILWLATAYAVWRDLGRRSQYRLVPYLGAAAIVLATPVLFPAAWLVVRMLRPTQTLDERESQALEWSLMTHDLPERCRGCDRPVDEAWLVCPACGARLAHRCDACDSVVRPEWDLCPWCTAELSPGLVTLDAPLEPVPADHAAPVGRPAAAPAPVAPATVASTLATSLDQPIRAAAAAAQRALAAVSGAQGALTPARPTSPTPEQADEGGLLGGRA